MKKHILGVVVTLSVIITLSVAVRADLSRNLKANIPFDFTVNGKTLPAGEYIVERGSAPNVLVIRSWKTKQAAGAITQGCKTNADGKPAWSWGNRRGGLVPQQRQVFLFVGDGDQL